jgi:hypothetical protein
MTLLWEAEGLRQDLGDANSELHNARAAHERAEQNAAQRQKFRTDMDEVLAAITEEIRRPGRSDFVTLRMIQEYAVKKNKRGFIKKIIICHERRIREFGCYRDSCSHDRGLCWRGRWCGCARGNPGRLGSGGRRHGVLARHRLVQGREVLRQTVEMAGRS